MTAVPGWVDLAAVREHVGQASSDLDTYAAAAAAYVIGRRPDLAAMLALGDPALVPADVQLATALLTARLWARRGTPTGLASYGEFGPAAIVRADADLTRLLGIGAHSTPRVG